MQKFLKETNLKFKSKRNPRNKDQEQNESYKTSNKNNKKKKFDKSRLRREFKAWKKNPPGPNEPKQKILKSKKYFYCNKHQS